MPIGVFDSGLGGLTVLRAMQGRLPDQSFIYLGDNANAPYGTRPADEIYDLTRTGVKRLFGMGCDLVILACNTASAVALHDLQTRWLTGDRRVLGVFVPMIEYLTRRDWGDVSPPTHTGLSTVALFATPATVDSGAFAREMRFRARDVTIFPRACPGLVDAIETGAQERAAELVKTYVADLLSRCPTPQSAVLGCTHYPMMEAAFRQALPQSATLISQPGIVADSLAHYVQRHTRFSDDEGQCTYFTTGDPAHVTSQAHKLMGFEIQFVAV